MSATQSLLQYLMDETTRRLDTAMDAILKVATGTLALSVTFRSSVAGDAPQHVYLLVLAWSALAVVPLAYVLAQFFYAAQFVQLQAAVRNNTPAQQAGNRFACFAATAVILMFIAFLVSVGAFVAFAAFNVVPEAAQQAAAADVSQRVPIDLW